MHVEEFVRGKGRFLITEYVATREKVNAKFPLILTTGRILSQYNVARRPGAPPTSPGTTKTAWNCIRTMPKNAASRKATGSASRAAPVKRYCAHASPTGCSRAWSTPPSTSRSPRQRHHHDNSDWATNCPEFKVTAVQAMRVSQPSEWQKRYRTFSERQQELLAGSGSEAAIAK